jgi:hypothetical protein
VNDLEEPQLELVQLEVDVQQHEVEVEEELYNKWFLINKTMN